MNNRDTICAVVVTYNRKKLLIECLDALRSQSMLLDAIYLIDNASTDGTSEFLLKNGYIIDISPKTSGSYEKCFEIKNLTNKNNLKLYYMKMNRNTGGAGGFHEGVKNAYKKGYDWLWLMDDDSEPDKNALKELSKYLKKDNISALASVVKNINGEIDYNTKGNLDFRKGYKSFLIPIEKIEYLKNSEISIDFTGFVGVLIKRSVIEKIGFPKKELFLYGDDGDYSVKLNEEGKILLITRSQILHKAASNSDKQIKKIAGISYLKQELSTYWLNYYTIRNRIWFGKTYSIHKIKFYISVLFDYLKSLIGIILFNDYKIKRINMVTNAYLDGLNSNFDNDKPKRILI